MSFSYWPKVAALALLPLAAMAQQAQQAGPADPNASVPASQYVSAFRDYRAVADGQGSPDETWRAANQAVANQDPHAGHMAAPHTASQAVAPAASPLAAPAPADPHAGHGSHHH
ncbi:hypothetical protein [Noviherbaspirillum soli]|uniref:hypothetical protein n=1 Tax=Noviherbaspirillum soli TaxID=1064518 RepID=UPI001889FDE9|nr:hypothetical protein [Noviherbaspirillum soli]